MSAVIHLHTTPVTHPPRRRWLGVRAYWFCQLIGWGSLTLIWTAPLIIDRQHLAAETIFVFALALSGALLTHLFRIALLRVLEVPLPWTKLAARALPWLFLSSGVHAALLLAFAASVAGMHPSSAEILGPAGPGAQWLDAFTLSCPIFAGWTGFYLGLRLYRQQQQNELDRLRLEAAVKDAELRALKLQLNPHFLFNALNTVRSLIPRELPAPREALTMLSEMLRLSLVLGEMQTVPLRQELQLVDHHLALERLRFGERLRVGRAIEPAALDLPVPPFLLQTLVENALKHGISTREEGGELAVEARSEGRTLHLVVRNSGRKKPFDSKTPPDGGLGLRNARARLRLLFGPTASLELRADGCDTIAEVKLPADASSSPLLQSGTADAAGAPPSTA